MLYFPSLRKLARVFPKAAGVLFTTAGVEGGTSRCEALRGWRFLCDASIRGASRRVVCFIEEAAHRRPYTREEGPSSTRSSFLSPLTHSTRMRYNIRIFSDQQAVICTLVRIATEPLSWAPVRVNGRYKSLGMGAVPFLFPQASPRFPGKSTRKWAPPRPDLVDSDLSPRPMPQESRVSLENSSTRSWPTSRMIPPLFVIARGLRGPLCHHAAVTSSVGLYFDPITFPPGRLPSPILRPVLPNTHAKSASTSYLTPQCGSRSTCHTFRTSAISPWSVGAAKITNGSQVSEDSQPLSVR